MRRRKWDTNGREGLRSERFVKLAKGIVATDDVEELILPGSRSRHDDPELKASTQAGVESESSNDLRNLVVAFSATGGIVCIPGNA